MKKIGEKEWREVSVVLALVSILIGQVTHSNVYHQIAFGILLLMLVLPVVFRPIAFVWFGLGHSLGRISSTIIIGLTYVLILLPTAVVIKLIGRDVLKLKQFKRDSSSVFLHRAHSYKREDILNPY